MPVSDDTISHCAREYIKALTAWEKARDAHHRAYSEAACDNEDYPDDKGEKVRCGRKQFHLVYEDSNGELSEWTRMEPEEFCPVCRATWEMREGVKKLARAKGAAHARLRRMVLK